MIHVGEAGVDIERREAFVAGRAVPLGCRAFDVLELLLGAPNRLVTKRELIEAVWPDLDVEENNIAVQIHALRKLLGINRQTLETVPRLGYRLNMETVGQFTRDPTCPNTARRHHDTGLALFRFTEPRG